ncbi:uncharacterized protein [Atheta coriaria]|uniref:uncharacterized protein isoform X2 n=1 Tax=Dalotia coriaria TaxID=877792 RepID=UPI0031F46215
MDTEEEFCQSMGKAVWIDDDPTRVKAALDRGFDPNYYDNDGATTLHRVAKAGCTKALKIFLQHDITRIDLKDHMQRTPLHYAASCNHFEKAKECCQLLLQAGLDIDAESNDIEYPTALFLCVKNTNTRLASYLLEQGADIDQTNFSNFTLLLQLLSDLHMNSGDECKEMLEMLLYYNIDVNYPFKGHPLLLSLMKGYDVGVYSLINYCTESFFTGDDDEGINNNCAICCVFWKMDMDTTLTILSKLKVDVPTMLDILIDYSTTLYQDLVLFHYIYKRLQSVHKIGYEKSVVNFFTNNSLSKNDFITAVDMLFNEEFGGLWSPHSIFDSVSCLFEINRTNLDLHFDDMANILCHMFLYIEEFCLAAILKTFSHGQFSNYFEIILKLDPLVSSTCCHNLIPTDKNAMSEDERLIMEICYPSGVWRKRESTVQSLKYYSRNAIRKCIGYARPENTSQYIFSYYNKVQRLKVPQIIKDIITLKHLL